MRFFTGVVFGVAALCFAATLTVRADELIVATFDQSDASYRFLNRYDAATGALIGQIALPSAFPQGLCLGPDGDVFVGSSDGQVLRFDVQNNFASSLFSSGASIATTDGIAFGADGSLYQAERITDAVNRFSGITGAFTGRFVQPGNSAPIATGITFSPTGDLFVASFETDSISRFDGITGAPLGTFGTGVSGPTELVFGPNGDLFVAESNGQKVSRFNGITGAPLGTYADTFTNGGFLPSGIAFAPGGDLYVAATQFVEGNIRGTVQRYNAQTGAFGATVVPAGGGGLRNIGRVLYRTVPVAVPEAGVGLLALAAAPVLGLLVLRRRK